MTTLTTTKIADLNTEIRLHHATRAKAEKLQGMLAAEYPALSLFALVGDASVDGWRVVFLVDTDEEAEIYEGPKVPDLADLLTICEDEGYDPEQKPEGEEEEPEVSGSVVPEHYRAQYREMSSNGQTCGDWLAEWLVNETHTLDGFNVDEFTGILHANEVDMTMPWAKLPESGQKGWIGRYRMNGRQTLEKLVAYRGWVKDARGGTHSLPENALAILQTKHEKWIAKEEKKAKAALNIKADA